MTAAIEALSTLKPHMRGWLHAGALPAAAIAGLLLVLMSPSELKLAAAVYAIAGVALFGVSSAYHRGNWGPKTSAVLKRMDHATIFVFIAATYTPFAATLITGYAGAVLLWVIWSAAALGVIFRLTWVGAPRWLTVPTYIAVGSAAVFVMPTIWTNGGLAIFALMAAGGICYIAGAVIYGLRRPNPSPKWFGFHEVFHGFTLGGYVTHYIGIWLAVFGVGIAAS